MAERDVSVVWKGDLGAGSGTILDSPSGSLNNQQVTWASRTGEPAGNTSPEELIAAAHASCFSMALAGALADNGTPSTAVETTATVHFVSVEGVPTITKSELTARVTVPGLDDAAFQKIAADTIKGCPVSRALAGVEITLDAALA